MTPYEIAPLARDDLENAWSYIARDNRTAATAWLESISDKIHVLANNPLLGEACPQVRPELRRFVVGTYVIYYRVRKRGIEIVRVLHGARDSGRAFEN